MPKKDDWDARFAPEAKRTRRRGDGRSQGLLLMLIAIGIPLVVFFLQVDGVLRLSEQDKVFERTLTTAEQQEIRAAIDKHKAKLDTVQRIVEEIKETYRGETGASYERDVWVVHVKEGLAIPFKYVLAFGAILFLIGIGKLIL
jgi:Tat protein secretion system quality control protein TatD with DNase activity